MENYKIIIQPHKQNKKFKPQTKKYNNCYTVYYKLKFQILHDVSSLSHSIILYNLTNSPWKELINYL